MCIHVATNFYDRCLSLQTECLCEIFLKHERQSITLLSKYLTLCFERRKKALFNVLRDLSVMIKDIDFDMYR